MESAEFHQPRRLAAAVLRRERPTPLTEPILSSHPLLSATASAERSHSEISSACMDARLAARLLPALEVTACYDVLRNDYALKHHGRMHSPDATL